MIFEKIFPPPKPPTTDEAERNLESAMIDLSRATDSRGLRIMLYRGGSISSAGFRDALRELTSMPFSADRVVFVNEGGNGSGERAFARHLQLLTNCYVAALEYERLATRTGVPS